MNHKIKKIIPSLLILLFVLIGFFGAGFGTQKAEADTQGDCTVPGTFGNPATVNHNVSSTNCPPNEFTAYTTTNQAPPAGTTPTTAPTAGTTPYCVFSNGAPTQPNISTTACTNAGGTPTATAPSSPQQSALENSLDTCGLGWLTGGTIGGCIERIFYILFYQLGALLLWVCAIFFNSIIAISLSSSLFAKSTFIPTAWAVVRDLSNLFFILVLLYVAIELILGIGHDAKKMIVKVIIIALLINFSLFFTNVIIDSSNILALIFYNKLNTCTHLPSDPLGSACRPYDPSTTAADKDISGSMVSAFDPSTKLNGDFFAKLGQQCTSAGQCSPNNTGPAVSMKIGIIVISGMIMIFAAYAFFIAGISFVGRLIELWILAVFSPFAFMSSTTPMLESVEYLGWKAWLKRLLTVAFMAAIFMFFMYFIFLLIGANLFGNLLLTGTAMETLLSVIIPALAILILLLKATDFAKKGSGALGEMLIKGTEIAMGAATGLAIGGAAMGGQKFIGGAGRAIANSETFKKWERGGADNALTRGLNKVTRGKITGKALTTKLGSGIRATGNKAAGYHFDLREGIAGGALAAIGGVSGLNLGHGSKLFRNAGGYDARAAKKAEKDKKRVADLKVSKNEPLQQKLSHSEDDLQEMLVKVAADFKAIDKELEAQRQDKNDLAIGDTAGQARVAANIKALSAQKNALRTGTIYDGNTNPLGNITNADGSTKVLYSDGTAYRVKGGDNAGATMKELQTKIIPDQVNAIETENNLRLRAYAEKVENRGLQLQIPNTNIKFNTPSYAAMAGIATAGLVGGAIPAIVAATYMAMKSTGHTMASRRTTAHDIRMNAQEKVNTK